MLGAPPRSRRPLRRPPTTDLHLHEHDGLNHRELPCRGCVASSSSRQIESTRPVKDVTEVTWHVALCLVAIEAEYELRAAGGSSLDDGPHERRMELGPPRIRRGGGGVDHP